MGGVYMHRLLGGVPLDEATAQRPVIGPVLVAHSMADFELACAIRPKRIDEARHLVDVLGMHPLEPVLRGIADLVFLGSHQTEPLWRVVHSVREQVPAPECLILSANAAEV